MALWSKRYQTLLEVSRPLESEVQGLDFSTPSLLSAPSPRLQERIRQMAQGRSYLGGCNRLREDLAHRHGLEASCVFLGRTREGLYALLSLLLLDSYEDCGLSPLVKELLSKEVGLALAERSVERRQASLVDALLGGQEALLADYSDSPLKALSKILDFPLKHLPINADLSVSVQDYAQEAKLIALSNPSDLNGTRLDRDEVEGLLRDLKSTYLLIDECLEDFSEEASLADLLDHPQVILLRSLSRSRNLTGISCHYLLASAELVEALAQLAERLGVQGLSDVEAELCLASLSDQLFFKQSLQELKRLRSQLTMALRALGFEVSDSEADFVSFYVEEADLFLAELQAKGIRLGRWDAPALSKQFRIYLQEDVKLRYLVHSIEALGFNLNLRRSE